MFKDSASVSEERTLNVMVTNVVRSKFMKVVSRVGCKHLQGSISNVTISKQDHKKDIQFGVGS